MKADSMVTSDFESAHAFPVKPVIIGFKRFKSQTYIFYHPNLRKQICWDQKWMLSFGPPTHFRFKPEIIGFIPLVGEPNLCSVFKSSYIDSFRFRKKMGWSKNKNSSMLGLLKVYNRQFPVETGSQWAGRKITFIFQFIRFVYVGMGHKRFMFGF